ncbi:MULTISPECIES: helix-hairpin-helix domain-containing protein [Actinopolyspora]|uniref:Competence protein ComEA n=1 Tax=Actinopolyspora saharensis TaxID=995062 RepID=A0A1H1DIJ5_9ACTN|nr:MULTISPECIES: helix-hairpin-helix domain-containing protein [Actinopolyspora]NHD18475.1 ComEA family DNA-binding protein [Actinopolyspora sp. BKK2]NHE77566.1 ComEA family DNA-binding protein [Actinopolyspora sp. BKK1]SDQ75676.1 competence protein ComEA [Actinopolyspora saharensis]
MSDLFPPRSSETRATGEDAATEGSSPARERLRELMDRAEDVHPADSSESSAEENARERRIPLPRWLRERLPRSLLGALPDPGRAGCFGVVAVAVLGCAVFAVTWNSGGSGTPVPSRALPTVERAASTTTSPPEQLVISVVGKVREPGLVTLEAGARVADALRAAGGPRAGSDTLALNLARELSDGEQLYVGIEPPEGAERSGGSGADSASSETLDLNAAEEEGLKELPGVGPVTAGAILRWRSEHGEFDSVEQLSEVDGIGPATLARLRDLVRV